jgi:hypothetical protein
MGSNGQPYGAEDAINVEIGEGHRGRERLRNRFPVFFLAMVGA